MEKEKQQQVFVCKFPLLQHLHTSVRRVYNLNTPMPPNQFVSKLHSPFFGLFIHSFNMYLLLHCMYRTTAGATGDIKNKWIDCELPLAVAFNCSWLDLMLMMFHLSVVTFISCLLWPTCLYPQGVLAEELWRIQCKSILSDVENNFKIIFM